MKISHVSGDIGESSLAYDNFAVTDDNGAVIAKVAIEYESDDTPFTAILNQSSFGCVSQIPGCAGDLHFMASVHYAIIKGFGEDHSFYSEQFYDEDGNDIEKEFTLLPL